MGENEKECTTECKSQRRLDEMAPWPLNYGSGEGVQGIMGLHGINMLPFPCGPHMNGSSDEGQQRHLSAYNLFVREKLREFKDEAPDMRQGEHLKKVGEMWRTMNKVERNKWRYGVLLITAILLFLL